MYEFHIFDVSAIMEIIPDMEMLFGKAEPPADIYNNKEAVVLTKEDDVAFLMNDKTNAGTESLDADANSILSKSTKEEL